MTLLGQVLSFCPKPIITEYQTRVDGIADFRNLLVAQAIGEQLDVGRLILTSMAASSP